MICMNETCDETTTTDALATNAAREVEEVAMTTVNAPQAAPVQPSAQQDDGVVAKDRPVPRTSKRVVAAFAAAALSAAALAALGFAPRATREAELAVTTQAIADARRVVTVASPTRDGAAYELRLPASTAPLQSTVIHARTDGYLKTFRADIGDRVSAGQVLAEIESPETDQQLREARARLEQRRADLVLATDRLTRVRAVYQSHAAPKSELDDRQAEHNAAVAEVKADEAIVARLESSQSFQRVTAPFDGIVTQRNVELGSLVTAGSSSSVTPLFRLEQVGVLKVFVDVPQSAAPSVAVGQPVHVEVRELPGRRFEGKVVRTAGTVDPVTRTLRVEIHLPNPKGELLAGAYAQVHLAVEDPRKPLRIPASALAIDATGPQVVTVGADNAVRRQAVTLGRDFGKELEVTGGLAGAERLVVNPRDDLRDGEVVAVR